MGLGPGIRRRLCAGFCLGCRARLGQCLLVRGRTALWLGACSRLAIRSSGAAVRLAMLVIRGADF